MWFFSCCIFSLWKSFIFFLIQSMWVIPIDSFILQDQSRPCLGSILNWVDKASVFENLAKRKRCSYVIAFLHNIQFYIKLFGAQIFNQRNVNNICFSTSVCSRDIDSHDKNNSFKPGIAFSTLKDWTEKGVLIKISVHVYSLSKHTVQSWTGIS